MLVTRIREPEYSPWPLHKYDSPFRRPERPRMSDRYDLPSPVQPDWQGQYPCLPHPENDSSIARPFGDNRQILNEPRSLQSTGGSSQAGVEGRANKDRIPASLLRCPDEALTSEHAKRLSPGGDRNAYYDKMGGFGRLDPHAISGSSSTSSRPNHSHTVLARVSDTGLGLKDHRRDDEGRDVALGEEVEFEGDDDDICAGEGDVVPRPQTTEERLAARRKMKRFRLTHQQTRFLMSEFAKQPHPDAAHRERLSREIPGLSPRQVQVWFQNRRAKIKRLTADDRDRVVRMRAVPDGFDNVQALHSPYGAVHGIGPTLSAEPLSTPYGHHMLRPLMVDVRRHEETYLSPGALTPSFGSIELGQAGGMGASDLVSPLSSTSSSKYMPDSHMPTSSRPMGASICQPEGLDGLGNMAKPGSRQGQPLQIREPMTRSAGDALQSPLRGGLSWKPETFDYSHYSEANSASSANERSPSAYSVGTMGGTSAGAIGNFDTPAYSGAFSSLPPSHLRPRTRASSASLPLSMDFRVRDPYRPPGLGAATVPPYSSGGPAGPLSRPDGHSMYSTIHSSAPQSAPVNLGSSRSYNNRPSASDETNSQVMSPIAAAPEYGRTFPGNLTNHSSHNTIKDYFGSTAM